MALNLPPLPKLPRTKKPGGTKSKAGGKPRKRRPDEVLTGPMWRCDKDGNIVGECHECQTTHRAIDLALINTWTGGYWYCRDCRPGAFKTRPPTVRVRG